MGRAGPLKLAGGTAVDVSKVVEGTAAADVQPKAPTKPEGLAPELDALWDEVVPGMEAAGLVAPSDTIAIEALLMHFSLMRRAFSQIDDVVAPDNRGGEEGLKKHPAESVMRLHSESVLEYAKQLGLTFVSRARTASAAKGGPGGERNPFAPTGS